MNFIIFDISKLLNALTLSKRLMGWRTKINSYTVNTRRIVVVYIYVYWLIFGHLSNDYELSAIKIRAEIYFRVKKSFFGRKFIFDLAEKYTTEISSEKNQIVFRKVTNLISKCRQILVCGRSELTREREAWTNLNPSSGSLRGARRVE